MFREPVRAVPHAARDPLLWVLAILVWAHVWRIQDLVPILGALRLNLIATGLAVALFALDRDPARRLNQLKGPVLFCALGLLAIAILGIPTSLFARRTAMAVIAEFVPNLLLMMLIAASVRGMRDIEWIALVNVLGAWAFCLFVNLTFEIGPGGRLEDLVYYDANDLALVLVCTIPFALPFLVRAGWRERLFAVASLVLFLTMTVRTGSRGGFLGLVAVLTYVLIAYSAIPRRVRLAAAAGAIGLLAVVAGDAYWERMSTLRTPQEDYNWSGRSTAGRMQVWERGLRYMAANPFLGVGMRNFPLAEGLSEESKARAERGAGFKWSAAHNSFLEIGAELGVIGLALFVAMLIAAFRALRRRRSARLANDPNAQREVAFASSLSASLVGFIVSGFFLSAWSFACLYVILGLVIGLAKVDRVPHPGMVNRPGWRTRFDPNARLAMPLRRHGHARK